jgi:hypothetical protein
MLRVGRATAHAPIFRSASIMRAVARLNRFMAGNRAHHAVIPPSRDARGCPPYRHVV